MGALDKLSKRMEDDSRSSKKAPAKRTAPSKPATKAPAKNNIISSKTPKIISKPAPDSVVESPVETVKTAPKIPSVASVEAAGTKKMGRPVIRGEKNKDYRMVNLAVPISMYEELKALGGGNVTYFINMLLKEALEERRNK